MYIENIKMDNSLKWVSFNAVSGEMTSNALWKLGEVLLIHFFFLILRAVLNIPIQTPMKINS